MTAGTATRTASILVVEDDPAVRLSLRVACQREGFVVAEAANGQEALEQVARRRPDLVLLDLMLPGPSGFDVCRAMLQRDPSLPVIFLTARDDEVDKVVGLELGADDYITTPFSPRELVARIRAVLRRSARVAEPAPAESTGSGLRLDASTRQAIVEGRTVKLTRTEYKLLEALVARGGRPLSRDELVTEVWGYEAEGGTRLLDSHIAHLRGKLEPDPARPRYIQTVRDLGYRFEAP